MCFIAPGAACACPPPAERTAVGAKRAFARELCLVDGHVLVRERVHVQRVGGAVQLAHEAGLACVGAGNDGNAALHGVEHVGRADVDATVTGSAARFADKFDQNGVSCQAMAGAATACQRSAGLSSTPPVSRREARPACCRKSSRRSREPRYLPCNRAGLRRAHRSCGPFHPFDAREQCGSGRAGSRAGQFVARNRKSRVQPRRRARAIRSAELSRRRVPVSVENRAVEAVGRSRPRT
ncbi:conserved hypothetical protein [Ricinus communis]|uniref:Uncharacterized protein n=1 Tax=Ricinus communis TaxID=3988 RepID=B9TPC7_RICCO|nr:conserved hypothetical protein [Ricinus communis]